jgi:cysteine desulfurase
LADGGLEREAMAARALTDRLAKETLDTVPGVERFGDPSACLPHLVCLGVSGVEAEPILLALDQHGVAVHSGSSCSSEMLEPSPVLAAMGVDADHSLRASVGWNSTDADVDVFTSVFPGIVERLQRLRTT